jgi:hypothetical protein
MLPTCCLQNVSYKDKRVKLESKADLLVVKEEARCDSEADALKEASISARFEAKAD